MANLSVRNLDDHVVASLRARAARRGVSMEEEVRRILQRSVAAPEHLGQLALELFGPGNGAELEQPKRKLHQPGELRS